MEAGKGMRAAFITATLALTTAVSAQEKYPSRRISIVVAAGAGGFADAVTRIIAEKIGPVLGQPVVIENRGGAGGNIAARAVVRSEPDGHTILVSTTSMAINGALYENMGYATGDITPAAIVGAAPEVLAVHPDHPAKSLAEFLKPADGLPVLFGTAGNGSGSHIAAEYLFKILAKAPARHVPFPGGAPAITNVLANQLNSVVATMPALTAHIQSGKLRGLVVMSAKRPAAIPQVPTLEQSGYPGYYASSWVGFFVPSKTNSKTVSILNETINSAIKDPGVKQRFEKLGLEPMINDIPATNKFFQEEIAFWSKRVSALGIKIK